MYRKKHIGSVLFAISHILWNIFLRISRDYWIPFYLVFPGEMVVMAIEINLGGEGMGLKEARLYFMDVFCIQANVWFPPIWSC